MQFIMSEKTDLAIHRKLPETRIYQKAVFAQAAAVLALTVLPFAVPSFRFMDAAAKIMIFTIVVASFDLLLGYTGILSFAHGMFFGIGAYSLALILYHTASPQWYHFLMAVGVSLGVSIVLALVIAFFSLRVKAIFFAMLTLALAEFVHILAVQRKARNIQF